MIDPRIILGQLLKAREVEVPVTDRITLTIVRPSAMDLQEIQEPGDIEGRRLGARVIRSNVIAWKGVLESDIIPGGASDPMPFDTAVYRQWIADRKDLWPALTAAFVKAIDDHEKMLEALKGN